ncbi:MAG: hypothetical protein AAF733_01340 [Verrucomicrobiota bacterium]
MSEAANRMPLPNYEAWREFITGQCEIALTASYCHERIEQLNDLRAPATKSFLQCYGDDYRMDVISWFEEAAAAAS